MYSKAIQKSWNHYDLPLLHNKANHTETWHNNTLHHAINTTSQLSPWASHSISLHTCTLHPTPPLKASPPSFCPPTPTQTPPSTHSYRTQPSFHPNQSNNQSHHPHQTTPHHPPLHHHYPPPHPLLPCSCPANLSLHPSPQTRPRSRPLSSPWSSARPRLLPPSRPPPAGFLLGKTPSCKSPCRLSRSLRKARRIGLS